MAQIEGKEFDDKLRGILTEAVEKRYLGKSRGMDKAITDVKILFQDDFLEKFEQKMDARRKENLENSEQLTLGELIEQLEKIPNKDLPVSFDGSGYYPSGLSSWRWVYSELAIEYNCIGKVSVYDVLEMLKGAIGKSYEGWKGGSYKMRLDSPLWVANHGENEGFKRNERGDMQVISGVLWNDSLVIIDTTLSPY